MLTSKRNVKFIKMRLFTMFITAVCVLFLIMLYPCLSNITRGRGRQPLQVLCKRTLKHAVTSFGCDEVGSPVVAIMITNMADIRLTNSLCFAAKDTFSLFIPNF